MADKQAETNQQIYECSVCGYLYDPAVGDPEHGIPVGTPFDKLPPDWVCPICGASQDLFKKSEIKASQATAKPQNPVKEYQNQDIIVYWYPNICSHSGMCWQGSPEVFKPEERPWINLAASTAEQIIHTIDTCPTRALQYSLPEGSSVDSNLAKGQGAKDRKIDLR